MEWSIQRTSGELGTNTDSDHCSLFEHPVPNQAWRGFWQLFNGLSTGLVLLFGDKKPGIGTGRQMTLSGQLGAARDAPPAGHSRGVWLGDPDSAGNAQPDARVGVGAILVAAGRINLFPVHARQALNDRLGAVHQGGFG